MKRILVAIITALLPFTHCLAGAISAAKNTSTDSVKIIYGANAYVVYHLSKGTFNVVNNGSVVLQHMLAAVKVDGRLIQSSSYTSHSLSKKSIKTGFGKGVLYTITSVKSGLPVMEQSFYVYQKGYFFTSVALRGKNLTSNYMVPLQGIMAPVKGDAYSLFMPFDNDTFISYNAKPFKAPLQNVSAEAGVVFDNDSRNGLIAGSVEHENWKTGVFTHAMQGGDSIKVLAGYTEEAVTRDKIAHGFVKGNTISSPLIMVGYFADWRQGMDEYARANRIAEPPFVYNWTKPTPIGWNSWGVMQEKLNQDKATAVAAFFADSLKGFREGNTAYIDLDSYWDNMVSYHDGTRDFSKLKQFADYCKQHGLQPGIYWAPFTDWGYQSGPDRKMEGSNYKWGDAWTKVDNHYHEIDGARAIDPTFVGTQRRIDYMIDHFKQCGFTMIKIDFLGHAAAESTAFYDTTVTTGMQAYKKGMEYLINRMDGQMLVYAAISPNLASGRYVHMRRIACDAFKTIKDTRYTLNSVTFGWWQTYLYNYVDADHVVFADESEGENRARLLSAVVTGTLITGDDYSATGRWQQMAKKYLQNADLLEVIKNGKAFTPVDGNVGDKASSMFVKTQGKVIYLAIFNYTNQEKRFDIDLNRLGIRKKISAVSPVIDAGNNHNLSALNSIFVPGADAVLLKITAK